MSKTLPLEDASAADRVLFLAAMLMSGHAVMTNGPIPEIVPSNSAKGRKALRSAPSDGAAYMPFIQTA